MSEIRIGSLGTGAITDTNQVEFSVGANFFRPPCKPFLRANGLVSAETIDLWQLVDGVWEPAVDSSGTAIQLTASVAQLEIPNPGRFGLTKNASAAARTVHITY